jgi:ABC-type branched-subunit amino acid transport system ATPase component
MLGEEAVAEREGLRVEALTIKFGGHTAVKEVSLSAPQGHITGLIGPNGAGKTTTFNACSGLLRPNAGQVRLFGKDVTRRTPATRARMGLGRTFQLMQLVGSMTVEANVRLGAESRIIGRNPIKLVLGRPGESRDVAAAAREALSICGISQLANRNAGTLSTGQRRLVELARVLAGGYDLLLLDEPSSGLDEEETDRFGDVLETVVADRGLGILLVEHDMGLVMRVCERIFVLDFGQLLFEGTADEVRSSPVVKAAYLGSEEVVA